SRISRCRFVSGSISFLLFRRGGVTIMRTEGENQWGRVTLENASQLQESQSYDRTNRGDSGRIGRCDDAGIGVDFQAAGRPVFEEGRADRRAGRYAAQAGGGAPHPGQRGRVELVVRL